MAVLFRCTLPTTKKGSKEIETASEEIAGQLVEHIIGDDKLHYKCRKQLCNAKKLLPFMASVDQRPDVAVYTKSDHTVCICEVESGGNVENTFNQLVIEVITQLRLLRMKFDIDACIGFLFPVQKKPHFAAMVQVVWEQLHFRYSVKILEKHEVAEKLKSAVKSIKSDLRDPPQHDYYPRTIMRITDAEITEIGSKHKEIGNGNLDQAKSRTIMFCDADKFYKYCTRDVFDIVSTLQEKEPKPRQVLLPERFVRLFGLRFQVFDVLLPSLTTAQAYDCLGFLLESVADAIKELHEMGYAHTDVRLDNICYKRDKRDKVYAVLIDLDRCERENRYLNRAQHGVMYDFEFDQPVSAKCYDWLQLGLMAVWVHYKGKNEDRVHCKDPDQDIGDSYHSMKVPELIKDKFVEEALAGTFRPEWLLASKLYCDHIVQTLEDAVLKN